MDKADAERPSQGECSNSDTNLMSAFEADMLLYLSDVRFEG
jgi:hypothetical protein